jgi:hypothetical protein
LETTKERLMIRFTKDSVVLAAFLIASVPCMVLTGCGDDGTGPDPITLGDFQGSWTAQTYSLTDSSAPAVSLELISMGATFEWDVDGSGNFSGTTFIPAALAGQDLNLPFQGTFTLIGQDSLVINFAPEIPPFLTQTRAEFTLAGNSLTLIDADESFDLDQDGNDEDVIFQGTLIRN